MSKPLSIRIINFGFKIISFFLPVKKRVLFLGSPRSETLMENTKLVYDNLDCEKKVIIKTLPHKITDVIYISYNIMTSKVIVLDDSYRYLAYIPLKKSQRLVQIWHAPGAFKKIGLDVPNAPSWERYTHEQYDAYISSSPFVSKHFESGFGLKPEIIKPLGYPLTDILLNNQDELEKEFYERYPEMKDKNIILYLPTFRRYGGMDIIDFDYKINWDDLNHFLEESNSIFLVKRHPLQIHQNINFVPDNYKNIIDLGDVSHFSLLTAADVLITDFSSAFFDYLLLDKPIIFYCPDSEEYLSKHGVFMKFPEELPGKYCETSDELIDILRNINKNVDYTDFKKFYMASCDGNSTEKVSNLIREYLKE